MAGIASFVVILAAVLLLAQIMRVDFMTLKVRNQSVLILFGLYVLWASLSGFDSVVSDLGAAGLLFSIALVMWLAGAMGAGDVKLYAVIGLFVGFSYLGLYVVVLLAMSILFMIVLRSAVSSPRNGPVFQRLKEFSATGKAPYAVPMCAAAIPTMLVRTFM